MAVVDDEYGVSSTSVLSVGAPGVLGNDSDIALLDYFDPVSERGAAVSWERDGSFTYDPTQVADFQSLAPGETTTDQFTYLAYGPSEEPWVGTVTLTITGAQVGDLNDPPVATPDTLTLNSRLAAIVDAPGLLANDTDPDANETLTVVRFDLKSARGADIEVNADGSYTYLPTAALSFGLTPGQTIEDSFEYTIADSHGETSSAMVKVDYTEPLGLERALFAAKANEVLEISADEGLIHRMPTKTDSITLLQADLTSALGAAVTVNPDGSFRYDPTSVAPIQALRYGQSLEDSFTYEITDGTITSTGSVSLYVFGVLQEGDDLLDVTAEFATTLIAPGILANDPGTDVQPVAFTGLSAQGATVELKADGTLIYDPTQTDLNQFLSLGETAFDQFSYTTTDAEGKTRTHWVNLNVAGFDHPLVAASDDYSAKSRTILRVAAPGLLANDVDVDDLGSDVDSSLAVFDGPQERPGDANRDGIFDTIDLIQVMKKGEFEDGRKSNSVWETGDWNNDGEFDVDDLFLASRIGGYEDPNAPAPDLSTQDISGDGQVDETDALLAMQGIKSRLGATIEIAPDGSFTYDPTTSTELAALQDGEFVVDEFAYLVTDSRGQRIPSFVRISVEGEAPSSIAFDDLFEVSDGMTTGFALGYNVLTNDKAGVADGVLSVRSFSRTSRLGAVVDIYSDGTFNYDSTGIAEIAALHPGETLEDDASYTVIDEYGNIATGTIRIIVNGVSEAPDDIFVSPSDAVKEVAAPGVLANDPEFAADPTTAMVVDADATTQLGAAVSVQPDGSFQYDPRGVALIDGLAVGETIYDSFTYTNSAEADAVRHRVTLIVSKTEAGEAVAARPRTPVAADPAGRQSVSKVASNPEFGSRYIAEFYEGMPEVIDPTAAPPTSQFEYEYVDFRGTTMLKIYLLSPQGGDNKIWHVWEDRLMEQIFVRNGKDTAVLYTAQHALPTDKPYDSMWIVGVERARNRFIDIRGTLPVVVAGGSESDYIELKNHVPPKTLPGEDFYARIETGAGNDHVLGGGAREKVDLGEGDDTARMSGGDDYILAGPGNDTVDGGDGKNLANPGPAGETDKITNASIDADIPKLDVIQRKLKPKELSNTAETENIWFDDTLPNGARFLSWRDMQMPVEVTRQNGQVMSGDKAYVLGQSGPGVLFEGATNKLKITEGATIFMDVFLDPTNPPKQIVANFRRNTDWQTGATWGANDVLKAGTELKRGEILRSLDGGIDLILQTDGNLVLYDRADGNRVLWASSRMGGERMVVQEDGNLVVYGGGGRVVWASNSSGKGGSLVLQQDGNLVFYAKNRDVLWASNSRANQVFKTTRLDDLPKRANGFAWK